jgi:hypothetical protein
MLATVAAENSAATVIKESVAVRSAAVANESVACRSAAS